LRGDSPEALGHGSDQSDPKTPISKNGHIAVCGAQNVALTAAAGRTKTNHKIVGLLQHNSRVGREQWEARHWARIDASFIGEMPINTRGGLSGTAYLGRHRRVLLWNARTAWVNLNAKQWLRHYFILARC
jgi:hypothetical protein